jgi:hypothetical protein
MLMAAMMLPSLAPTAAVYAMLTRRGEPSRWLLRRRLPVGLERRGRRRLRAVRVGVMSLTGMALVAALVALEKVGPWPRAATAATAAILAALTVAILAAPHDVRVRRPGRLPWRDARDEMTEDERKAWHVPDRCGEEIRGPERHADGVREERERRSDRAFARQPELVVSVARWDRGGRRPGTLPGAGSDRNGRQRQARRLRALSHSHLGGSVGSMCPGRPHPRRRAGGALPGAAADGRARDSGRQAPRQATADHHELVSRTHAARHPAITTPCRASVPSDLSARLRAR